MSQSDAVQPINVDITLIGGGIAGLWLLNRLRALGYNAILFEQNRLGGGQTIASQGMIHGGMKYTLGGAFTKLSETIANMPSHWRSCLAGQGDVCGFKPSPGAFRSDVFMVKREYRVKTIYIFRESCYPGPRQGRR